LTKAYDSLQFFSLRPTLERFNLPNKFINLMENILCQMNGSIKTFYGLTNEFNINKSIRQGDPIAPLLFVLWIDALHDGIYLNPYTSKRMGYKFNAHKHRIASLGFADDIVIFGEYWKDIYLTHQWVREFLFTHGGSINKDKTVYLISNVIKNDPRWLHTCNGNDPINPSPIDTNFRYLGLNLNLNLEWNNQINKMNVTINQWCIKVINSKISFLKGIELYKMILLPRLDYGLTFATIPDKILNRWSRKILKTLFQFRPFPIKFNYFSFCYYFY